MLSQTYKIYPIQILLALMLMAQSLPREAFAASQALPGTMESQAAQAKQMPFSQLGNRPVIHLRNNGGRATVNFSVRADELVTKASLKIRYTYSPALIPNQSHIKILLNNEAISVIPVTRENAGRLVTQDVDIDPRFIAGFNQLTLQLVGHYATECEDALHSSLWADISGTSVLELNVRPLALSDDLAVLPEPFFDRRDMKQLRLPFVLAKSPDNSVLQAAGIAASWFGSLAAWRGAHFPVAFDQLQKGHSIVLATNKSRPAFLVSHPPFTGPALSIMTNPADGFSKLLLISGRDGEDLREAAKALALKNIALAGSHVAIGKMETEAPRRPYDAPRWVRLDRPMKFSELIESPQQLQIAGHPSDTIRLGLRIPPDVFMWNSPGVPVNLKFRYTPPSDANESRLNMGVNDEFVQAFHLRGSRPGSEAVRVTLPLVDGSLLNGGEQVRIPAFKLGTRNQLQYDFSFARQTDKGCRDTPVDNLRAMIDADSTIDFTGFPNYATMPHIGYFATAGFPFTKFADLSQTTVVLPNNVSEYDVETMLGILGRMGESTGYPATGVTVARATDKQLLTERDLIVFGTVSRQPLLQEWRKHLPAGLVEILQNSISPIQKVAYDDKGTASGGGASGDRDNSRRGIAALAGFESPLSAGRSVVAVTALNASDMARLVQTLSNEGLTKSMRGGLVLVHADRVESIEADTTYTLGSLPIWTRIWYPLSERPLLILFLALLTAMVAALLLRRLLKAVARRRLGGNP